MEDEIGIKSIGFTNLPLPSEEIKLLNSVDLPACVWNLMVLIVLDFLFSWGINVFRALPSSSLLIVVIRPLKWFSADVDCQYFKFSSEWDGNSARTSARSVDPWDPHTGLPSSDVKRNTNTASASQSASSLPSNQLSASSSSQGLKIAWSFTLWGQINEECTELHGAHGQLFHPCLCRWTWRRASALSRRWPVWSTY